MTSQYKCWFVERDDDDMNSHPLIAEGFTESKMDEQYSGRRWREATEDEYEEYRRWWDGYYEVSVLIREENRVLQIS